LACYLAAGVIRYPLLANCRPGIPARFASWQLTKGASRSLRAYMGIPRYKILYLYYYCGARKKSSNGPFTTTGIHVARRVTVSRGLQCGLCAMSTSNAAIRSRSRGVGAGVARTAAPPATGHRNISIPTAEARCCLQPQYSRPGDPSPGWPPLMQLLVPPLMQLRLGCLAICHQKEWKKWQKSISRVTQH
jgi:hypothetical protein